MDQANLRKSSEFEQLNLRELRDLIARWLAELEASGFNTNPLTAANGPKIILLT